MTDSAHPLAERHLDAYRRVHDPGTDAAAAALARVHARIEAGDEGPAPGSESRVGVRIAVAAVALAAAVILAWQLDLRGWATRASGEDDAGQAAVYAGERDSDGGEASSRAPASSRRTPRPEADAVDDAPAEPSDEPEPEPEPAAVTDTASSPEPPAPVRKTKPRHRTEPEPAPAPEPEAPTKSPPSDATLHAELALLKSAQAALRADNPARALERLDRHASSFPDSMLAEEREVARIEALCALGRTEQAHRAQRDFDRAFRGSPLAGRADKACPAEAP